MAGAAGAFLSLAQLSGFVENMVAGRGFLAIACVVFARWHPVAVLAVALAFGIADSAQIRLQAIYPGVPYQFFVIAPYLLAVLSLATASRSAALPAALGDRSTFRAEDPSDPMEGNVRLSIPMRPTPPDGISYAKVGLVKRPGWRRPLGELWPSP